MVPAIFASGWACDQRRVPRIGMALIAYAAIAALSVPMFMWFPRGWATCWGLQLVFMVLLSVVLGKRGAGLGGNEADRLPGSLGSGPPATLKGQST
jgi:hypothetical protein